MILAKMKLDESFEMDFEMLVQGTTEKAEEVRFVIECKEYDIVCQCVREGDNVKVNIPKLKGIVESGSHDVRLETIIDGRIFVPLRESVEFLPLVEFDVKKTKAAPIKEGVTVKLKSVELTSEDMKTPKSGLEANLRKAMEEGLDVTKIDGKFILKRADKYVGTLDENSISKTDVEYSTYTEMCEGMK